MTPAFPRASPYLGAGLPACSPTVPRQSGLTEPPSSSRRDRKAGAGSTNLAGSSRRSCGCAGTHCHTHPARTTHHRTPSHRPAPPQVRRRRSQREVSTRRHAPHCHRRQAERLRRPSRSYIRCPHPPIAPRAPAVTMAPSRRLLTHGASANRSHRAAEWVSPRVRSWRGEHCVHWVDLEAMCMHRRALAYPPGSNYAPPHTATLPCSSAGVCRCANAGLSERSQRGGTRPAASAANRNASAGRREAGRGTHTLQPHPSRRSSLCRPLAALLTYPCPHCIEHGFDETHSLGGITYLAPPPPPPTVMPSPAGAEVHEPLSASYHTPSPTTMAPSHRPPHTHLCPLHFANGMLNGKRQAARGHTHYCRSRQVSCLHGGLWSCQ